LLKITQKVILILEIRDIFRKRIKNDLDLYIKLRFKKWKRNFKTCIFGRIRRF